MTHCPACNRPLAISAHVTRFGPACGCGQALPNDTIVPTVPPVHFELLTAPTSVGDLLETFLVRHDARKVGIRSHLMTSPLNPNQN